MARSPGKAIRWLLLGGAVAGMTLVGFASIGAGGAAADATAPLVWVANYGTGDVTAYPLVAAGDPAPLYSIPISSGPNGGLAFDTSNDLWVSGGGGISEFSPSEQQSGGGSEYQIPGAGFSAIAFDSHGDLWALADGSGNSKIVEYAAADLGSPSPVPAVTIAASGASLDVPDDLAFDAAGDLWVGNYNGPDALVEYTPAQLATDGAPTPQVVLGDGSANAGVQAIAFDATGNLWLWNDAVGQVEELTTGQLTASGTPTPQVVLTGPASIYGLAFDSSGDLWGADYAGTAPAGGPQGAVEEYSPSQLQSSGSPAPGVIGGATSGISNPLAIAISKAPSTPPPSLSLSHTADGANGWNVSSPVTETLTGSGLSGTPSCTVDGAGVSLTAVGSGSWTFPVSGDGIHAVSCSASDPVTASDTVKIDTTAPAISATHTSNGQDGYSSSSVTETVTASDNGSGLSGAPSCTVDATSVSLTAAGSGLWTLQVSGDATHEVSCTVSDVAGNANTATDTVKIAGAPTIDLSTPTQGSSYTSGSVPALAFSCSAGTNDPGISGCTASIDGGTPVASGAPLAATIGKHTVVVIASSSDGQTATDTVSYTVAAAGSGADIAVSLQFPTPDQAGHSFQARLSITDKGPEAADDVFAELLVPAGVHVVGPGTPAFGGGELVIWRPVTIQVGQTITDTLTLASRPNAGGRTVLEAAALSLRTFDPNWSNNIVASELTISGPGDRHDRFGLREPSHANRRLLLVRLRARAPRTARDARDYTFTVVRER